MKRSVCDDAIKALYVPTFPKRCHEPRTAPQPFPLLIFHPHSKATSISLATSTIVSQDSMMECMKSEPSKERVY